MPEIPTEFKTEKGTVLPLMNLKGKPYLQVAHRLVWFREECPDWSIITKPMEIKLEVEELVKKSDGVVSRFEKDPYAIYYAEIRDGSDTIIATGTKMETRKGFADFVEKAETGAIGRALASAGYGTQFAPEMDEGTRLADSPIDIPVKVVNEPVDAAKPPVRKVAAVVNDVFPGAKAV